MNEDLWPALFPGAAFQLCRVCTVSRAMVHRTSIWKGFKDQAGAALLVDGNVGKRRIAPADTLLPEGPAKAQVPAPVSKILHTIARRSRTGRIILSESCLRGQHFLESTA
jgi:hypothetical protein